MDEQDIRWRQRFENYKKALAKLGEAVELHTKRTLNELEKQGVIHTFEFTHELACRAMHDFFINQGNTNITGARDATRHAFNADLITDGDGWMEMINSRNIITHTYNEAIFGVIYKNIVRDFYPLLLAFREKMEQIADEKE